LIIRPSFLLLLLAVAAEAQLQKPIIRRVANAASYSTADSAAGSIATIFGTNLAASTETATTVPLPTSLGGTRVSFGSVAVYLFYVSPSQINFQVPWRNGNEPPSANTAHVSW
jgi:uncharacterized protein (TIGR03437 family)